MTAQGIAILGVLATVVTLMAVVLSAGRILERVDQLGKKVSRLAKDVEVADQHARDIEVRVVRLETRAHSSSTDPVS
jgi:hypothetical protein